MSYINAQMPGAPRILHAIHDFLIISYEFDVNASLASTSRVRELHARVIFVVDDVVKVIESLETYAVRGVLCLIGIIGLLAAITSGS